MCESTQIHNYTHINNIINILYHLGISQESQHRNVAFPKFSQLELKRSLFAQLFSF